MNDLNLEHFCEYFEQLWQWPPFAWQKALAKRALESEDRPWPQAIALPTASGKTACIDIAVFAMAARAKKRGDVRVGDAPRRIFFVVDRRVIVDEAYERAAKIAKRLKNAETGVLKEVADRLRELSQNSVPLMVFQLRGGMYRSDAWSRSPLQAEVVATTVDQIGSRLLFRAYGRSPKAWPIQAGLAGNDSLILLDEAHCSQPFMETLHAVQTYRRWAETPLPSSFHVSIMSATPPDTDDVFTDDSDEPNTPGHPLGDRRLAVKKTVLQVSNAKGKNASAILAKDLAETAERLADGNPVAVVVFANYVATARHAFEILSKKHGRRAILLTGRMRPVDKDDVVSERLAQFDLASARSRERSLEKPVFVVATQTLEVGADLDFDAMVTECAALDALRQRFGRLDRMGRGIGAKAAILIREDMVKSSDKEPVYGESLSKTWQWLSKRTDDNGEIDMGIAALSEMLPSGEELEELNAPSEHAPVMLPAHVDCWGQTMPDPCPSPDPSVFLRGPSRASADVQVCWRADIDLSKEAGRQASLDALALCPPSAAECLAVPLWVFKKWLDAEQVFLDAVSDVESAPEQAMYGKPANAEQEHVRRAVRWRGREEADIAANGSDIRPGDVVVVSAAETDWQSLGDLPGTPADPPVLDWGDRAYARARARAILRLHPDAVKQWPENECKQSFLELAQKARALFDEDPDEFLSLLKQSLAGLEEVKKISWLSGIASLLTKIEAKDFKRAVIPHPSGKGVVVKGRAAADQQAAQFADETPDWFSDEDDASASGTTYIPLQSHLDGVSGLARRFAAGCALSEQLVETVAAAGALHDTGKADPRFQALLRGGNPWAQGELLAKSEDIPQGLAAYLRARKMSGYPEGGRHELLSVRLAESAPETMFQNSESKDLALHLIESHHGHCRPFAPVVEDSDPLEVQIVQNGTRLSAKTRTGLERLDSGVADRFWRLTRRYGWWGLAWLESILRLADHRQSEHEEINGRKKR